MFCSNCGKSIDPTARFCPACGTAVASTGAAYAPPPPPAQPLFRPRYGRAIGGVCAAFAIHYGWDLSVVRILTVLATLALRNPAVRLHRSLDHHPGRSPLHRPLHATGV